VTRRAAFRQADVEIGDDTPLRLDEACALLNGRRGFPRDLKETTLRTEIRKGRLRPARVAGKFYVTPAQIKELFRPCPAEPKAPASTSDKDAPGAIPSGSSVTERLRSARAAALASNRRPSGSSGTTSPASSRSRSSLPTADVIRLKS
jgi:hypothetical protein